MSLTWYFAYGSNMQAATFRGRRGIEWRRAVPARVPGWRLVLDKPSFLPAAGAVANVIPDATAAVIGVAYEITEDDLAHVELTEGVLLNNYRRVAVPVEPLQAGEPVLTSAFTLTSDRRDPSRQPTTRYMGLIIEGAIEHGLPADYIEQLRAIPAMVEGPEALEFRAMIDQFMKRA